TCEAGFSDGHPFQTVPLFAFRPFSPLDSLPRPRGGGLGWGLAPLRKLLRELRQQKHFCEMPPSPILRASAGEGQSVTQRQVSAFQTATNGTAA
ncbi:hypothetical protein HMPREF9120_00940, partial [Neisseria sp. oral taxon 020 str. F0370]